MLHRRTSNETTEVNITASTTQTQGNGALLSHVNEVETVANDNDTVTLFAAQIGGEDITIINNSKNILQIFPASGDDLGNGTNIAMTLGTKMQVIFYPLNASIWARTQTNPANVINITTVAEWDALFVAGVRTVTDDLSIHFFIKVPANTNRFIITGAAGRMHFSGNGRSGVGNIYSGTGDFLTVTTGAGFECRQECDLESSSTGKLMNMSGGGICILESMSIVGWTDLGTFSDGIFFWNAVDWISIVKGITLVNPFVAVSRNSAEFGVPMSSPAYIYSNRNLNTLAVFDSLLYTALPAGVPAFDIGLTTAKSTPIYTRLVQVGTGDLFKVTSVTNATINSIADTSPSTGTITAMASNGLGGTTVSSTTTYFEDEELTLSGTTSYNGTFYIFNVVTGVSFDIAKAFVADDATGSVTSIRRALTLTGGHGITTGNSLKIINTNFYNGFVIAIQVVSDVITVNGDATFVATETGAIERNVSLDQTDQRVIAENNFGFPDSRTLSFGAVNSNTTLTSISDGSYSSINLNGFTDSGISERFRLVNATLGIWKYIAPEPFNGFLSGSLSAIKTGSTANYRFAMSTNSVAPTFATANYVPMEVKTTKINIAIEFSVSLTNNDTIQLMSAGDGTANDLTVTDVIFGIK